MDEFEYGVMFTGPNEQYLHRGPWSKLQVDQWLRDTAALGLNMDLFVRVSRPVGDWEVDEDG